MSSTQGQATPRDWREDPLGGDYRQHTLHLGNDPEGEGQVFATVVRYLPEGTDLQEWSRRPALLWVHGMTDYFFHTHVAEYFHDQGYAFYAVDLRKCGRSRREEQRWHYSDNLQHYFPDLAGALDVLSETHGQIFPIGHSTGGLIVTLWADHLRRSDQVRHARLGGLVLNSPWLDMMYPKVLLRLAIPALMVVGKRFGSIPLPGGNLGSYGVSIHKDHHGEWEFDVALKPVRGFPKFLAWARAVVIGHKQIHEGGVDVGVPVLTLCSARSWLNHPYSPASDTADAVLDVTQIQKWAPKLGTQVEVAPIEGARHDIFLSLRHAREEAFKVSTEWLAKQSQPASR